VAALTAQVVNLRTGGGRFAPGASGNPGGRPPEEREVLRLARAKGVEAIERLAYWMASDNPKASISAANALLDRAFGKPNQPTSNDDSSPPVDADEVSGLPKAVRDKLREALGASD
jgi:hypothetical protein